MSSGKKNASLLYIILTCFFIIIFAACVLFIINFSKESKTGQEVYEELANEASSPVEDTTADILMPSVEEETIDPKTQALLDIMPDNFKLNLDIYKEQNEDVYSYIHIPNTYVSYPILQHPSDDYYYLNYNIDHTKGYPGTIYTESINSKDWSDPVTLIYGHNMLNGSMFASLHNFENPDFFENNRYVYIYDDSLCSIYEIFAAVTYSDDHIMKSFDFSYEDEFNRFIDSVYTYRDINAHYLDDYELTYDDKVIVLSTCCSNASKRFIVCAAKLGSVEY